VENCVVLLQAFRFFVLSDFVSAINLKNKPPCSVSDGMTMDSATFSSRGGPGLNTCTCNAKYVPRNTGNEKQQNVLFIEELKKNIENQVAWFLAELCKFEKGVQKDKRNEFRTELVRGWSPPRLNTSNRTQSSACSSCLLAPGFRPCICKM